MNWLYIAGAATSLALNIVLIWYSIRLLRKLFYVSQNTEYLVSLNTQFTEHITSLYELEMYYGDTTLENLLNHSRYIVEEMENFNNIFSGIDELTEFDADADEEIAEEEEHYGETTQQ